jgi:CspA family cold shock protein
LHSVGVRPLPLGSKWQSPSYLHARSGGERCPDLSANAAPQPATTAPATSLSVLPLDGSLVVHQSSTSTNRSRARWPRLSTGPPALRAHDRDLTTPVITEGQGDEGGDMRAVRTNARQRARRRAGRRHTGGMQSEGTVRSWSDADGWGVIDSPATPGGCWVHFSNVVCEGFRRLTPGDHVTFTYEALRQDGFDYRAILVWPPGIEPGTPQRPPHEGPSAAYRSSLTIRWPDGSVTRGIPERGQGNKEASPPEDSPE